MSKFQIGDEVSVVVMGRITEIREGYDKKLIYKVEPDTRQLCIVFEENLCNLPTPENMGVKE